MLHRTSGRVLLLRRQLKKAIKERNLQIARERANGRTLEAIAKDHNMSRFRVMHILKEKPTCPTSTGDS